MKEALKLEINRRLGGFEGEELYALLESHKVGDNIQFYEQEISIPADLV